MLAAGLTPHYQHIFDITRLSDFITIVDPVDSRRTAMKTATVTVRPVPPATAVIEIGGDVTAASEEALSRAHAETAALGASHVILDFSGLEYMNSGGIGMLVTLLVRAQREHQRLAAVGLSDHYRQIFELTRLDEAITLYADESAALAAAVNRGRDD